MNSGLGATGGAPLDVALAHDYLLVMRGAERTFLEIAECWPEAPISTLFYDERGTDGSFAGRRIKTSYLNRLGVGQGQFRKLLPLLPGAARLLEAPEPVLVSSSSAFAHGIRSAGVHVCYCHSPFRYAWFEQEEALAEVPAALKLPLRWTLGRSRAWDLRVSRDVDAYIANSRLTQERIGSYWGRESTVVHPPVEVERFSPCEPEDYFLFVGELVGHKRVQLALEACRLAGVKLRVVGTGPDAERLASSYGGRGAEFLGRVSDVDLAALYQRCLALLVPNVEEFGITAVETQAAGRPVLAVNEGGALETVIEGETGVLVPADPDLFAEAIRETEWTRFSSEACVRNARRFAAPAFRRRLLDEVERIVADRGAGRVGTQGRPTERRTSLE